MRLLVASTATQGDHPGDFNYCSDGEPVIIPIVYCDRDENAEDPSTGGCGCGRSFTGLFNGKGTTTAEIRELDIGRHRLDAIVFRHLDKANWPGDNIARGARIVNRLVEVARRYPTGTVLGSRLGELHVRTS